MNGLNCHIINNLYRYQNDDSQHVDDVVKSNSLIDKILGTR
jgi:hypothetical protein